MSDNRNGCRSLVNFKVFLEGDFWLRFGILTKGLTHEFGSKLELFLCVSV